MARKANLREREAVPQQADMQELMCRSCLGVSNSLNICDDEKLQGRKIHIVLVNPGFFRTFSRNIWRKQRIVRIKSVFDFQSEMKTVKESFGTQVMECSRYNSEILGLGKYGKIESSRKTTFIPEGRGKV